jgi:translocation and assembly module TamB
LIYRWLYKLWRYFWITVGTLLGIAVAIIILAAAAMQLPQTKEYIRAEIVSTFNNQFEGELTIDEVRGFLPLNAKVVGGRIYAPGDSIKPVFRFDEASITINWWELLQQNLAITSFQVQNPKIFISKVDEELNINKAFKQRTDRESTSAFENEKPQFLNRLNIFAPYLSIIDGEVQVDESIRLSEQLDIKTPLILENVNATMFLEITDTQLFADILNFSTDIPGTQHEYFQSSGQFYSDQYFFELNRFSITTNILALDFSLEATPVNLFASDLAMQFQEAEYTADVQNGILSTTFIKRFLPDYPDFENHIAFEMNAEGNFNELYVDQLQASLGQSFIIVSGVINDMLNSGFSYRAQLENLVLNPEEVQFISGVYLNNIDLDRYGISTLRGDVYGDLSTLNTDLRLRTDSGSVNFDAFAEFNNVISYEFLTELNSLDITPFIGDTLTATVLEGRISGNGRGFDQTAKLSTSIDLRKSTLYGYLLEKVVADLELDSGRIDYSVHLEDDIADFRSSGYYIQNDESSTFSTDGRMMNVDFTRYTDFFEAESTQFNGTFSANIQGNTIEDLYGRVSIELSQSMIGADTLRSHQLYADINSPENASRTLRFTSSFFDGEMSGTLSPGLMQYLGRHWTDYLRERIREEILFDSEIEFLAFGTELSDDQDPVADVSLNLFVKDLKLLRLYLPDLPELNSKARITASVNANRDKLSLSGNLFDEYLLIENKHFENINSSVTASFNYRSSLKENSSLNFQANFSSAGYNQMTFEESFINLSMRNDSLEVNQKLLRDDELSFESKFSGVLSPGQFQVFVNEFNIGSPKYNWSTIGNPVITYSDRRALTLQDVILSSDNDLLVINGTFSTSLEDSVEYNVNNFDISRISDLIGGRIAFSGIMDGEFVTRSLTEIPSIQGNINILEGRINNRIIGDLTLNSTFNSTENRFDTDIRIFTDPVKYSSYYQRNENIGQDLRFNGYFKIPDDEDDPDTDLFYFDADLREIDMWIVTFIAPMIIEEMEGKSSGKGFIRGSLTDYDFDATFQISNVYGVPLFTNVGYILNGELDFNRSHGLLFRDISLRDNNGGSGRLSGQVELHDFDPTTTMNLTLNLNNLHFMNNPYDPDVPFYSSLFGTGQARITGTNFNPLLRTTTPVILSSNSRISIPLREETGLEQDRRFIQFVDTFDLAQLEQRLRDLIEANGNDDTPQEELTFIERFTMDLQFAANNPIGVQLIFDPVTNEILNANGTGQVRILLEDQDVSMFGRFNIQGGDYQFVSGDIFTRRFTLLEGGSISWQGDLIDANLNVTAIYRARPSVASLLPSSSSLIEPGQRIPVELVLQIGGTIMEVENDFFFRVPTGIEGTVDPTIATQINNLNQNEEEKLIQATSILISGNFLPSSQAQGLGLGEGFTGTAAVVNPLLTSQIINPLLSNQINSLLRSDITFDIDLNLTALNEVDLGVALRLFDDRVILRREGQITGEQSDIGDLGATYRINRTFSLTAFHRQDPTLSFSSSAGGSSERQTQEMNGVGVEARVQFNTWKEFRNRISNAFRGIFGLNKREDIPGDEEPETIAEN